MAKVKKAKPSTIVQAKKASASKGRVRRMYLIEGSSMLLKVGYDPESMTMVVQFHNLDAWSYAPVLPQTFTELLNAESPGKYFISIKAALTNATKVHSEKDKHVAVGLSVKKEEPDQERPLLDMLEASTTSHRSK